MENKLKEHIKQMAREAILKTKKIEEESTSDCGCDYSTPKAFGKKKIGEDGPRFSGNPSGKRKKGKGRPFIPDSTILPGEFIKPGMGFKVMASPKSVLLFISVHGMEALGMIKRGRTAADEFSYSDIASLSKLFRERIPSMTRVLLKKSLKSSKIKEDTKWIPVNLIVKDWDPDTNDVHLKVPKGEEGIPYVQNPLYEIIEQEILNEGTYKEFKNDIKYRTKNEQLHKAIKEVNRKLCEIDRLVEYTTRMKTELSEGEEGLKYWKATERSVGKIQETITQISNKLKNLNP